MNDKTSLADRILTFLGALTITSPLPRGVKVLNPYHEPSVMQLCQQFYHSYYHDNSIRRVIIGINPGRLGGGLTGIPFTDPVHLEKYCHIKNSLQKKTELSSTFIYEMIAAYGGPEKFYSKFYFSSVSPLGFTKEEKNLNYYDDARLQKKLMPFILTCLRAQLDIGIDRSVAYCLGEGENFKFLNQLNEEHQFFKKIIPLAHPRFILQYKSKSKQEYIERYLEALTFTPEKDVS
jgi:hypothetical protein